MKAEARLSTDTHKKTEKENLELKKSLSGKQNALDKLRKERDELWAIVNTEKYKSIQSMESDQKKSSQQAKELETKLNLIQSELTEVIAKKEDLEGKVKEV